ncbi:synaptotagmin-5-like isoform X2 [Rhineura floridana]|uniref:synaptotagmin-5-like isoform X2 n=1 Tax=Rhineura floridana TaxID=261503 RepID=UPI002AC8035B|nr:synaptotagmin-5-like isoform X2 [Rhineura floridana]
MAAFRSAYFGECGYAHLQVFLGLGLALLCFCLLGCAICWHRRKKRHLNPCKTQASDCALVDLGPILPTRMTAVPVQQQYVEIEGEVLQSLPPAAADSSTSPSHNSPPRNILRGRASLPSICLPQKVSLAVRTPVGRERRCTISGDSVFGDERSLLSSPILGAVVPQSYTIPKAPFSTAMKPRPHLHFTLFYSQLEATLTVTVIGVSHLPKGIRASRNSYVKVYLLPGFAETQRTALRRKSLNPEFHEQFRFGHCNLEELPSLTLRFAVYAKEFHNLKDSFIGEVLFPCAQVPWNQGFSSAYTQELSTTKTKLKKCYSSQDVSSASSLSQPKSMGQLFLLLQYQAVANRIKVLVRKAENLGRVTCLPGTPDHYVLIHLYHNGKVIDTKETKSIAGFSPVWNSPFLFSVPAGVIQEKQLSLEFTVMQARLYTRSCAIGRVLIGPIAPEMGQVHWKEMCSRGNVESARWHTIQPEGSQLYP